MSENKWTKGPWKVDVGNDNRPYIMGDGYTLAKAYRTAMRLGGELIDIPGGENANLISAAPDLAEALEKLCDATMGWDVDDLIAAGRAALSKARGTP